VKPVYFRSARELASWLRKHGDSAAELWIGFYKKDSGKAGITYREALDEALCTGWIDGIRKGVDEKRFRQRFTPRKKKSIWSAINIRRVGELTAAGRMKPAAPRRIRTPPERACAVFVRVAARTRRCRRFGASARRACPGLVRGAATLLSADGQLLGDEREAGGDARAPSPDAHRLLSTRRTDSTAPVDAEAPVRCDARRPIVRPSGPLFHEPDEPFGASVCESAMGRVD
jgi:hypothetical protein